MKIRQAKGFTLIELLIVVAISGFISPDLAANGVVKSGYTITLAAATAPAAAIVTTAASTCNTSAANAMSGYFATANPVTLNTSGTRFFGTDTRGSIFQN